MKKSLTLFILVLFFSVSLASERTDKITEKAKTIAAQPQSSAPVEQATDVKDATEKIQPAPFELPAQPDRALTPAEQEAETFSRPYRPATSMPMQTDNIRGPSETWRDLNTPRSTPEYLQSKPRERDPFYDTVERTGGNPMNTRDRTTNRRVPR